MFQDIDSIRQAAATAIPTQEEEASQGFEEQLDSIENNKNTENTRMNNITDLKLIRSSSLAHDKRENQLLMNRFTTY